MVFGLLWRMGWMSGFVNSNFVAAIYGFVEKNKRYVVDACIYFIFVGIFLAICVYIVHVVRFLVIYF